MIRSLTKVLSMCFLIVITTSINAETIELSSASGNTIAAEYLTGIDNSNPVVVLHGFLQTYVIAQEIYSVWFWCLTILPNAS